MSTSPVVSVFGGASVRPGDPAYAQAERLGGLLAGAGYTVMTGGYSGTMEAASKGAKEAGGHVIGVTAAIFEVAGRRPGPNAYVDQVIRHETLRERVYHLVARCDAAVALPGGIGTLSEVALTWSLLQVGEIAPKPFVLVGEMWRDVLAHFYGDGAYVREASMALMRFARTPEDVLSLLKDGIEGAG
jgi:uncharacterized protein (TIGR00730 family)